MCGISGFLGEFTEQELLRMNDVQSHRGPDDHGIHRDGPVSLAHRRLSIIDVAGGHQPMSNEDGTVWIVFNGEVYNFRQLRKRYLSGHTFTTNSDTEVVIHLYEEFGENCLENLRGMFAFAIWDSRKGKLFLARDRFGIKPLYHTRTPRGFAFASEVKALLELNDVGRAVNRGAMDGYLTFRYVPGDQTMFRGIHKLEPGHFLVAEEGRETIRRYWDIAFRPDGSRTEQEYADELRARLEEAIDLRLISEVPLGAYLSGGLDSSFIVGLMSGLKDDPVQTFTVGLGGKWHDESEYAGEVADTFGTDHHLLKVRADAAPVLARVIWHLDEPMADAATIPTYLMSELTRRHVTVVLSGEGADELLAGYAKYKAVRYGRMASMGITRAVSRAVSGIAAGGITSRRLLGFLARKDLSAAYVHLASVFSQDEKQGLLGPELRDAGGAGRAMDEVRSLLGANGGGADILDRLAYLDIKTWLPNDVLLKNDKMTMAHSLEARVPFLDHEFAEFVASIPSRLKLRWLREKHILRRSMTPLVPKRICRRRKHGFTVPVKDWMTGELRGMVLGLFESGRLRRRGYWNPSYVRELLDRDLGNEYYRRQLWTLLTFEIWHEIFIDGRDPDDFLEGEWNAA